MPGARALIPPSFRTTQLAVLLDSKWTQGEGICVGTEQGNTWGEKWQEVEVGGPCTDSQPPKPNETTLLARAQEFISVPEGPRALLGHRWDRAAAGSGAGCDI